MNLPLQPPDLGDFRYDGLTKGYISMQNPMIIPSVFIQSLSFLIIPMNMWNHQDHSRPWFREHVTFGILWPLGMVKCLETRWWNCGSPIFLMVYPRVFFTQLWKMAIADGYRKQQFDVLQMNKWFSKSNCNKLTEGKSNPDPILSVLRGLI